MDNADRDVKQAQANVAKASLQLAQIDLNHTRITSPISGRIGQAKITKGNYVSQGSTLAVIAQIDPIRVLIDIPDNDYLKVKNNDLKAEIKDYNLLGVHDFNDNYVTTDTGTIKTWWSFDNPEGSLIPGATVHVILSLRTPIKAVLIPQASKLSASDGNYVYVVRNNAAHLVKIDILEDSGSLLAVSGVNEGELVVTQGTQKLFDNAPVQIQD